MIGFMFIQVNNVIKSNAHNLHTHLKVGELDFINRDSDYLHEWSYNIPSLNIILNFPDNDRVIVGQNKQPNVHKFYSPCMGRG